MADTISAQVYQDSLKNYGRALEYISTAINVHDHLHVFHPGVNLTVIDCEYNMRQNSYKLPSKNNSINMIMSSHFVSNQLKKRL